MPETNQMIGRYRLLQRLGAGGMGEVWKALDTGVTQREVALKLVLSEDDPQMLHVLAGEARAMAQLPMHPNLVALHDVVEEGASLALVMEYVPGPSLRALLRSYPTGLPWALLYPVAEGLLHGLEHAHGHRVIHRDLKPENIKLLSFDGSKALKPNQVKILDFGLARAAKEQSTRFTKGASGTFAYMAPEQLTGQAQGEATDLYALGILLFEMACGHPPFGGPGKESFGAVYQGHTSEPPPLPSRARADAPPEFDQALLMALAKQPSARSGSAEELGGVLLPVLARLAQDRSLVVPVAAVGLPALDPGSRPAPSPPRTPLPPQVAAPAQGNLTVMDARSSRPPGRPEPPQEPSAPPVPPPRRSRPMVPWLVGAAVVVVGVLVVVLGGGKGDSTGSPASQSSVSSNAPLANNLGMKFVKIPAGTFQMGTSGGDKDEAPAHSVTISRAFFLATTVVTQGQWEAVMGNNPSKVKGTDLPVEQVSWDDAQAFIERMNQRYPGKGYRLPTEAEWEYACRAGSTGERYGDLDAIAWYDQNSGRTTHPVGQKQPNAWGLYDMNGNVWQWCQDWYGENYYGSSPSTDPQGPPSGSYRVFRGGSWVFPATDVRSALRLRHYPGFRNSDLGFRLLRTLP